MKTRWQAFKNGLNSAPGWRNTIFICWPWLLLSLFPGLSLRCLAFQCPRSLPARVSEPIPPMIQVLGCPTWKADGVESPRLLFSLCRLGQLSRADFSILLAAHLKLSIPAHCLGGHSMGGRDDGFWNLPWSWSISGEIALYASNFPAIELPDDISLCLYFTLSLPERLLPFPFIYSFEMTPPIFNLYQNLEAWYLFCRSVAHPFSLRPLAGGWRAWHPRGGAAINFSPGDRRTNQSAAGYQEKINLGKG